MIIFLDRSFYYIAEDLITVTAQISVYYYILVYVPRQKIAARFFVKLSTFDTFGKPPDFDEHSLRLEYIAMAYKTGVHIVVIAYFSEPFLTKHSCEKRNAAEHVEDVCGLVTASWMPFNIRDFPYKQLFYLWQSYSLFWTYEGPAAVSFLIVGSTKHVLVRFWHLKMLIKNAIETDVEIERKEKLSLCLEYHQHIFE